MTLQAEAPALAVSSIAPRPVIGLLLTVVAPGPLAQAIPARL